MEAMRQTSADYPFDPYDWTTISPLYEALLDAPIAADGFMAWLKEWNALDIAVHDAWTRLKQAAYYDTRNIAAERAYQAFVEAIFSTHLDLSQRLIARALSVQPDAPTSSLEQLWRRWLNQSTLFHPDSLPIQAEISRLEGSYREIMRNWSDTDGDPFAYWTARRVELNDLMFKLLRLRHQLARICGEPDFLHFRWRELNRLDYSIADCQSFHRMVELVVVPVVARARAARMSPNPLPSIDIPEHLAAGVERILQTLNEEFGAIFHSLREGYLDLGSRPGKAPAIEAWFFPASGMPYLHVETSNPGSVIHESGHGIHEYLSFRAQQYLWNSSGPEEFQEFAAVGMELLCWSFYDQAAGGPFTAAESAAVVQQSLAFYGESLTNSVMQDAFEHWVYGEAPDDATPADFDAKWLDLMRRFTPWDIEQPDVAKSGWQRWTWSLYRIPLYMITYPLAIVAATQLGRRAQTDRATTLHDYRAALTLGNTRPLPDLFGTAGITFPFTEAVVEEAMSFIEEHRAAYGG